MWKQRAQVRGRSSALERAQAVLSSRRGRAAPAAHSGPPRAPSAQMSTELLSDLSESSLSSVPGRTDPGPQQTGPGAPEVAQHVTPLDPGVTRFLKRPSAAAQDQPKERAVSSSLRASQTAALSRLSQIENRFGKSLQRSPSRAGQAYVQDLTEGQLVQQPGSEWPGSAQSRRFVKSRPQGALVSDTAVGRPSEPSEHSIQESNSRQQLYSEARELHHSPTSPQDTSPVQPQTSLSPSCVSPSPPSMSPSEGSACGDVRSLEELFPLEEPDSDRSDARHFRINLMDLDDLGPAALLLEEQPSEKEAELQEELPEEELQEDEVLEEVEDEDYPSDFESVIHTEGFSEHSQDSGQPPSPRSQSTYSNTSTRATTSVPSSPEALPQPDISSAKASRDTAGQTFHLPAHCGSCPSMGLLMESLRQQLALTSHFISSAQEHHARVLEGLGPPNYRYTTLEDTVKYISTLRASRPRSDQWTEKR